ncbi:NADH-dependent flavin oxidoreductase [candidate division GN15 bacterium]|nr:NADH-dependent flavin oxidoreductase [candidate division GN15 bacterium]
MAYEPLFQPLSVNHKLDLPNRLVMAPMTTTAGELDGSFSEQEIAYLAQRARAGIGLIMTPACYCHKSGHSFERQVGCHTDDLLPSLSACAGAINAAGAASFLQIHHGGNAAKRHLSGGPPWAPSAVHNRRGTSELPHEMTDDEIETIVASFAAAAQRARRAGFTGIEIHGANTYLFQQFFSPFTNRRTDRWGVQTWENRTRFSAEVVRRVREAVGADYPIAYRLSPEEDHPDGYDTEDAIRLLDTIVPLGIDIVHVSSWEYGAGLRHAYPNGSHPTRMIREAMPPQIPVIGVGGITLPDQAMRVLEDGVELVAIGRELLLDADWATKVRAGELEHIRTAVTNRAEIDELDVPERMKDYLARFFISD